MSLKTTVLGWFVDEPNWPEMPIVKFACDSDKEKAFKNYIQVTDSIHNAKVNVRVEPNPIVRNRYEIALARYDVYVENCSRVVILNDDDKKFQRRMISVNPEIIAHFVDRKDLMEMALKEKPSVIKFLPEHIKTADWMGELFLNHCVRSIAVLPEKFKSSPGFIYRASLIAKDYKKDDWEGGNALNDVKAAVGYKLKPLVSYSKDFITQMKELAEKEQLGKKIFNNTNKSAFKPNTETSWVDNFIKK